MPYLKKAEQELLRFYGLSIADSNGKIIIIPHTGYRFPFEVAIILMKCGICCFPVDVNTSWCPHFIENRELCHFKSPGDVSRSTSVMKVSDCLGDWTISEVQDLKLNQNDVQESFV